MFGFFSKKKQDVTERYAKIGQVLSDLLAMQQLVNSSTRFAFEDDKKRINGKALGYIYGFLDCALQFGGLDIRSREGQAALLTIVNRFSPDKPGDYVVALLGGLSRDADVMNGVMLGGNEYKQFIKSNGEYRPYLWHECF